MLRAQPGCRDAGGSVCHRLLAAEGAAAADDAAWALFKKPGEIGLLRHANSLEMVSHVTNIQSIARVLLSSGEMAIVHIDPSGAVVVDGRIKVP